MVIYEKPIPIKSFKQNFEELEIFCKHNRDVEIAIKVWVPAEVCQYIKQRYGSTLIVPHIGQTMGAIFTKLIDEAAFRRRSKTSLPNPVILTKSEKETLLSLQGFLGNDPLRMLVSDMYCLSRYYCGEKEIST